MPVLVEGGTLLGREAPLRAAVERLGGAGALGAAAAFGDGGLLALAFPPGEAAVRAQGLLARQGFALRRDGEPGDLAAVGQRMGPAGWWPWLEVAALPAPGAPGRAVLAARLAGREDRELATQPGWRFEGSLSERHGVARLRLADRPLRHLRREPAADVYLDRLSGEEARLPRGRAPVRVVVEDPGGGRGEVEAEVAASGEEVEVGLMFREALPPGAGMLFWFDWLAPHRFWMKNTLVPLDLLFAGDDGRVVALVEDAPPRSLRWRGPPDPVRAVLEVPAGWCRAHGVAAGARLAVAGPAAR